MNATITLGKQGRIVIPAEIRAALDLHAGDELSVQVSDRRIVLICPRDAAQSLRGYVQAQERRSLVDELIAERRDAARLGK